MKCLLAGEYREMLVGTRPHCWHDFGGLTQQGYNLHGQARCCWCGAIRSWYTVNEPLPDHGPHFTPTVSVRRWCEEMPECRPAPPPVAGRPQ